MGVCGMFWTSCVGQNGLRECVWMCFNTFNDAMLESRGTTKTALAPSHSSNQFITSMSFCRSIFCACSLVWVKLLAKQLRGFCTGRSPFGCGKWPLQLIFSEFDMP